MTNFEKMVAFQEKKISEAVNRGEEIFLGIPDAWYDDITWGDENGHISNACLKTDKGKVCLACQKPLFILPVGTTEDDLKGVLK